MSFLFKRSLEDIFVSINKCRRELISCFFFVSLSLFVKLNFNKTSLMAQLSELRQQVNMSEMQKLKDRYAYLMSIVND